MGDAPDKDVCNYHTNNTSSNTCRFFVLLSCFLIQFIVYGLTNSFGVVLPEIMEIYGHGKGTTAWIGSISTSLILMTGPLASMLTETFGYRVTTVIGSAVTSCGLIISIFVPNIYLLYLTFGVMTGFGSGLMTISSILAVTDYFQHGQAMAVGVICSGGGIGLTVYPMIYRVLLDEYGWKWSLLVHTGIYMNGIACGMMLRPRENRNLHTGNSTFGFSVLRNRYLQIYIIVAILNSFAFYIPLFYLPAYASSLTISSTNAAFLVSLHGITSVFSRLFFGWLADRPEVNTLVMYSILPIIEGVVVFCIPNIKTYSMLVFVSIINGLTGTVFVSMATAVLTETVGIHNLPSAFGFWCFSNGVGILIGPPLAGWFYDITGSYISAFYLSGSLFIVTGLLLGILPVTKCFHRHQGAAYITSEIPSKIGENGQMNANEKDKL